MSSMVSPEFSPQLAATKIAITAKIRGMAGRPAKQLKSYPNRLRATREALGLSLEQVAQSAGVSHQRLARYETGDRVLKVPELERIAQAMNVPPAQLLNSVDPVDDEQERALLGIFRRLSPPDRDRALRMATALLPSGGTPHGRRKAAS
jgi:transcriptional regulator with XRE-family HTH domain